MRRSAWFAMVVVSVALAPLVGERAVLASTTTRYEAETGGCPVGWTGSSNTAEASASFFCSTTGSGADPKSWVINPANDFVVVGIGIKDASASATGRWRLDGGSWQTFSEVGPFEWQATVFTSATIPAGEHTIEWGSPESGLLWMDAIDVVVEDDPPPTTTTTTTVPPTTTTTVPPTTTTTVASLACDWEHGGVVETPPEPCDVPAELPGWALLAGALLVFTTFAALVGGWRS